MARRRRAPAKKARRPSKRQVGLCPSAIMLGSFLLGPVANPRKHIYCRDALVRETWANLPEDFDGDILANAAEVYVRHLCSKHGWEPDRIDFKVGQDTALGDNKIPLWRLMAGACLKQLEDWTIKRETFGHDIYRPPVFTAPYLHRFNIDLPSALEYYAKPCTHYLCPAWR